MSLAEEVQTGMHATSTVLSLSSDASGFEPFRFGKGAYDSEGFFGAEFFVRYHFISFPGFEAFRHVNAYATQAVLEASV